jgi:CTP:phosphocholine cytidylyltransferase-like protein
MNIAENKTEKKRLYKVDNAVIMAAGLSSRFAPLSFECPKALYNVRGEILIERQIKQLKEAGIDEIAIVVGYKKELFYYLRDKYDSISIVENPEYYSRNNHSTLYYVRDILRNTYICSADNYFTENIFESHVEDSFYSAVFEDGRTDEWCITFDNTGLITNVVVGGTDSWVMQGHAFFSENYSEKFVGIIEDIYMMPETKPMFWEDIYINHINELPMYIRKYPKETIFEFDSLDELRAFDESYWDYTGSKILQEVSKELGCKEGDIIDTKPLKQNGEVIGFTFSFDNEQYRYLYCEKISKRLN